MRHLRRINQARHWLRTSVMAAGLAAAALLTAQAGAAQTNTDDYQIDVVKNDAKSIVVNYHISDFQRQTVRINDEAYEVIAIDGESQMTIKGAPDLVNINRSLAIPNDALMEARVVDSRYYDLSGVKLAPSKGHINRKTDPNAVPFTFGATYSQNAFFPSELVKLREPYILRDVRGSVLEVNPFQYNPVTETLRVYTDITVEVANVGSSDVNVLNPRQRAQSRAFVEMYGDHFLNYDAGRYPPVSEDGDLLVICYDAFMGNAQPYVDHKNSIGINTTMVAVSTIGNNSTAIKNYLQSVYDSSNLAFVLLVGDSAQVATINASGGGSDPSYALLAGNDNYPDILIGRFSAENAGQVDTQVERTIEYENMPAVDQDWFWKGVGIASAEGAGIGDEGQSDKVHMAEIRNWLLGAGYTHVDGFYDPGATDTQVRNAVNEGRGVINYCGHGWLSGWSTSGFDSTDANNLTNDNMLPFIISVACNNGEFGGATCFAEVWMRATNGGEPTGSIGFFGSSISCSWAPPMEMQDEFNLLLTDPDEPYHTLGALCFAGSASSIDDYGYDGITIYNVFNLFGDPTLRVRGTVAPPTGMKVSGGNFVSEGPNGGPFTPESASYLLTNFETYPLDFTVGKSANWLSLSTAAGTIPAGDTVEVIASINSNADSLGNGGYTDTLSFVNTTNHDGDASKDVELTVGVPVPIYLWNMDTNPGWQTEGQWAWGDPTGQGGSYGNPDPQNGYTGTNVYGYNLNGDYANNLPEYDLTTTAIDCSELVDVQLKFRRWLGVEQPTYDHAYLRVSTNGSNWTTIWQNTAEVADGSWQLVEFDISGVADQEATLYIRWTMGVTDTAWQYCGWNIDDVEIWGTQLSQPCLEDLNGDGSVGQDDLGILLASYLQDAGGDIDGDGDTDQADLGALLGMYGEPCP